MEYWDILTSDGKRTGKRVRRDQYNRFLPGEYHLVVHIWLVNSKGELLIQKRSEEREPMPGEWAATSGSALSGEISRGAALRELREELGIEIGPDSLQFLHRFVRKNSIIDIWWARLDVEPAHLTLQKEEVTKAAWVGPQRLREMVQNGTFHYYGADYFKEIFTLVEES